MAEAPQPRSLAALGLTAAGGREAMITGLSVDSRTVRPGHLFAALPGSNVHGGAFIQYALRMDAAAVLTDSAGAAMAADELAGSAAALIVVEDPRAALAYAAALWFGRQPAFAAAVTGTNGKTSVATFTRQIFEALGLKAANFGTTGIEGAFTAPLMHTTPEPITLHRMMAGMADAGVTHVAMEASSHGLAQRRLDGMVINVATFTNFSQDHLDYHADFEDYFQAKLGLFTRVLADDGIGVVNIDDARGAAVLAALEARGNAVMTVGRASGADFRITAQRYDATGQDLLFQHGGDAHQVRLNLIGGFQADNVLAAAAIAIASGQEAGAVIATLPGLGTVAGRMELAARRENGASVFVDYAHTPEALATALKALRPHVLGRLVVVFGAGGDRDQGKRPLMGQAAAAAADVVFVTDDNPRTEDPALIRRQVLAGCPEATEIADRAEAILRGVDALGPGDVLLVAGKGHETGQTIGEDVYPFDDREQSSVAVAALEGRL